MLTDTHPAFAYHPRLAYALSVGKVAITFRKVTDNENRTIVASRSPATVDAFGSIVNSDDHRPNPTLIEILPEQPYFRLRSFYPSEVISWTMVSYDE